VKSFKYLGLFLENNLNWKMHLEYLEKILLIAVHKFYKLRYICPRNIMKLLYHSLIESVIMYGISSWGGTYYSNVIGVYKAQKRIVKIIYFRAIRSATLPLFRDNNILPLRYLYVFRVLKIFFYRSGFVHHRNLNVHDTRNPYTFKIKRCNLELFRRCYLYMAPFWFHMLPCEVKSLPICQGNNFEKQMKAFIFNISDIEVFF